MMNLHAMTQEFNVFENTWVRNEVGRKKKSFLRGFYFVNKHTTLHNRNAYTTPLLCSALHRVDW